MKTLFALLLTITISTIAMADDAEVLCKKKWKTDYSMLEYCIKGQRQARADLDAWYLDTNEFKILDKCTKKWTKNFIVDYEMALYCSTQQYDAKERLRKSGTYTN